MISLLAISLFAVVSPQERPACAICVAGNKIEFCQTTTWTSKIINCEDVVSVSGEAFGKAIGTYSYLVFSSDHCPPHKHPSVTLDPGFFGEPAVDGGIVIDGFLGISGSAAGGKANCGCAFSFIADFNGTTMMPYCYLRGQSTGSVYLKSYDIQSMVSLEQIGYGIDLETCTAGFSASIVLETSAPLEIENDVVISASSQFVPDPGCEETTAKNRTTGDFVVEYVGEEWVYIVWDSLSRAVSVSRGVIGFGIDGTTVRLGIFDDSKISVTTDAFGETTVAGDVVFSSNILTSGTFTVVQFQRQFGSRVGDYNGDGDATPADYDIVYESLGATIADAGYSAGVDIDMSGTISQFEVDRAEEILDKIVGIQVCEADLNSDGLLNFFDISVFLSLLLASDPVADWDQNGLYNFFDLNGYINDFNQGCL